MTSHLLLHLSLIPGIGPATIKRLLETELSDDTFYRFSVVDFQVQFQVSENSAQLLVTGLADKKLLEAELQLLEKHNIAYITINDVHYPPLLKNIHYPSPILYVQGALLPEMKFLAMVGSRKADHYGKRIITTLMPDLVASDLVLVSGGAIGADTLVHEETLRCGGKTIAVIGSGLLRPYPSSNRRLFEKIVEQGGAILSPFHLTMQALPGNFPARNRIIAGMSFGCVVIQAAIQSGALITARYALDEGRHVYTVPGYFDDPLSAGCHILLGQGANIVTNSADILKSLQENGITLTQYKPEDEQKPPLISPARKEPLIERVPTESENPLVELCRKPQSLDDLIDATGLSIAALSTQLFELQLEGKVEQDFNGAWKQKKGF
ncbi:MAG: DNA-processing protein DprA [Candidatus Babeliaceae bacterium]